MRAATTPPPVEFLSDVARHLPAALSTAQLVPFATHLRVAFFGGRRALRFPLDSNLLECFDRIFSMELRLVRLDVSLLSAAHTFANLTYLSYHEHPLRPVQGTRMLFKLFPCMPNLRCLLLIEIADRGYGRLLQQGGTLTLPPPPFRLREYYYYGSHRFPFWHLPVANSHGVLRDLKLSFWRGSVDRERMAAVAPACETLQTLHLAGQDRLHPSVGLSAIQSLVAQCPRLQALSLFPTNEADSELEQILEGVLGAIPVPIRILELGYRLQQVFVAHFSQENEEIPATLRALRVLVLHFPGTGAALDAVRARFSRRRVRVVGMGVREVAS